MSEPKKYRRRNMCLDDDTYEALARIAQKKHGGKPNRSDGVRVAVRFWLENHQQEQPGG